MNLFRLLKTLLLLLILVVAATALYAFWPFSADLDHIAVSANQYDVEIVRDTWGVPHVLGATDVDAAFGLGYAHAEDDFLTIQQGLVAARGDLGLVYGADAAPNDYMVELLRIWDVVDAQYDTELSPEVRAICEAYADGLNQYASEHEDEAIPGAFPVTGRDVVAGSVHKSPLFFGLDGTLGRLFNRVQREGEAAGGSGRVAGVDLSSMAANSVDVAQTGLGSNVFAVAPGRSADNQTYFAVNSHQPWNGPVTWYEAHIQSDEGWDITGALFPGMPVMVQGHNRHLAWAFTVNKPDLKDVYELTLNPDNDDQYWFDGAWRDFEIRDAPIEVNLVATMGWGDETFGRFPWTVTEQVYWSEYGPVIKGEASAYAIRYAGYGSVGIYEQLYRMNRATTLDEWQAALNITGLPMFNAGYADKTGNIGYIYNALLPIRSEQFDWDGDLPGDTSDTIWTEYLPVADLPQLWNPASGYVQNANSSPFQTTIGNDNPNPANYNATFGIETSMSNRALRLNELFSADESVTWDEFVAIKYDMVFSAESDIPRFVDTLTALDWQDPAQQKAANLLNYWNLHTNPENPVTAIMMLTLHYLNEADGVDMSVSNLAGSGVTEAQLVAAFKQAVTTLETHYGRVDVAWGEVNRVRRGSVDVAIGGSADIVHAVYGELQDDGRFKGIAGDSYIQLIRWDADGTVYAESIHQFGAATLIESSPHYADQASVFAARQLKPAWIDEADIRANAERTYRPGQ